VTVTGVSTTVVGAARLGNQPSFVIVCHDIEQYSEYWRQVVRAQAIARLHRDIAHDLERWPQWAAQCPP
jgi:hypothetical protein